MQSMWHPTTLAAARVARILYQGRGRVPYPGWLAQDKERATNALHNLFLLSSSSAAAPAASGGDGTEELFAPDVHKQWPQRGQQAAKERTFR